MSANLQASSVMQHNCCVLLTFERSIFLHRRWAQQLGGIDFLPPPPPGAPLQGAEGADGNVLAGLAEYRQGQRALKVCRPPPTA